MQLIVQLSEKVVYMVTPVAAICSIGSKQLAGDTQGIPYDKVTEQTGTELKPYECPLLHAGTCSLITEFDRCTCPSLHLPILFTFTWSFDTQAKSHGMVSRGSAR